MFKGLKFRERVEFWWKNKIWLTKVERCITEEQYGMIIYEEKGGLGIYGAYRSKDRSVIIPISAKNSYDDSWKETYYERYDYEKGEGYIFGTRKILYKSSDMDWNVIYDVPRPVTGMLVNMQKKVVVIFKEREDDEIYRINKEQILQKPVITGEIVYVDFKLPWRRNVGITGGNMEIVTHRNKEYYFYSFTENDMYDPKIKFIDPEEYTNFLNGKAAKAYSVASQVELLVTLVDGKVKEHYETFKFYSLGNNYYCSHPFNEKDAHLLKYISNEEIIDLGIIPKEAVYDKVEKILGIDFIVAKQENGITLLAINGNNELKTKFYKDAVEIRFAEPVLFENGNVIEVKPIAVYEKLIEEN